MRTLIAITSFIVFAVHYSACRSANAGIDLDTGETIFVEQDTVTGVMVNKKTRQPVRLYVDRVSKDTIYGPTGEVVNNRINRTDDGRYVYAGDYKIKGDDYKEKREGDEYKVKSGDYKMKEDNDEIKIKTGDRKIKIDKETGERKEKIDD